MSVYHEFKFKVVSDDENCCIAEIDRTTDGLLDITLHPSNGQRFTRSEFHDFSDALRQAGQQLGWYN